MSDLDYEAVRGSIEKRLSRQKWLYRILFFVAHMLFFAVSMLVVWGIVAADSQLRDVLFNHDSGAGIIVILPTILWTAVLLFHAASIYFESGAGEKAIRKQLLMREIGDEMARQIDGESSEKPKRQAARRMRLSDDGEFVSIDEEERTEQRSAGTI